jgi:hypothetical protein
MQTFLAFLSQFPAKGGGSLSTTTQEPALGLQALLSTSLSTCKKLLCESCRAWTRTRAN